MELDGQVNLADFNTLAANVGQSNRTFSQGGLMLRAPRRPDLA